MTQIERLAEALNLLWDEHDGEYGYITPNGFYATPDGCYRLTCTEVTVTNL